MPLTDPIAIVADVPSQAPGLGFPEYVDALSDAIRGGEPAQFTIGLYGAWGSGKSSLLRAIAHQLSVEGSNVIPVLFDAWRHERAEHIVVPLLHSVSASAAALGHEALTTHVRRVLGALLVSLKFNIAAVELDMSKARSEWEESGLTPLDEAFARPFSELQRLPSVLKGARIAVLIDDLDRCSPDKVVALLEAINLITDVEGFIFVLALDYDVLINAITTRYPHVSGHQFIEKMVQVPFRVPPVSFDTDRVLDDLIPDWDRRAASFPAGFGKSLIDVSVIGLRGNPRQVKRLVNSFLLLQRVADRRGLQIESELMTAMIGMQLRWPDDFRDLQDAVLAADDDPYASISGSEDEDLTRYASRFFSDRVSNDVLRQLLQLTAVVAPEKPAVPEAPVRATGAAKELREQGREQLEAAILARAWRQPYGKRTWYSDRQRDFRLVMQKTSVRLEARNRASETVPWVLATSWDFRAWEDALADIDGLEQKSAEDYGLRFQSGSG